jgi:malonyl-CoA/methylmalonyl-CoA synthetase
MNDTRVAIVSGGCAFTYGELERASKQVAGAFLRAAPDLDQARVAFLVQPGFDYAAVQRGIWRAGGVAVPLATSYPPPELEYVMRDAQAAFVVADAGASATLAPLAARSGAALSTTSDLMAGDREVQLPDLDEARRAMIIYTSGTTGRPKGVVTTHSNIRAQIAALIEAWEWSPADRLLLALPLHHVHGIINGLGCALAVRATCEVLPAFEPTTIWDRLSSGEITVFSAVPAMYHRLIAAWDAATPECRRAWSEGARQARLMMSGSSALPAHTLIRWRDITGHTLLERYGMTEIAMALANPLHGERRPGFVGRPLPGVQARVADDSGHSVAPGTPGELEVRGPGVFLEYWQRPAETAAGFRDGWFRTGDIAVVEQGIYRLLGRKSIDIIKTGGYKVSALEIEETLRLHPAIGECAIVGLEDPEWGQRVAAAVELRAPATLSLPDLRAWAKERLAPYKLPTSLLVVDTLPRNAMGKVVKPEVAALFRSA